MKKKFCFLLMFIVLLAILRFRPVASDRDSMVINLEWHKSYPSESWDMVRKGLLWSFSYMGAELPKNSFNAAVTFKDSSSFSLDLNQLGFNKTALTALHVICDSIKSSEDYQKNNALDLGRFLLLTMYSPYHYYKITGVEPNLESFVKKYRLELPEHFGVTKSSVSKSHRLIKFTADTTLFGFGFLAEEGHGSLQDGSFKAEAFEVFDFMANGQLRYAVYDKNGQLTDASPETFSSAGKIGKCMWCHETYVQPLYIKNIPVDNMLSNADFEKKVFHFQDIIDRYRKTLDTEVEFDKKFDHTSAELVYIGFMEPSLYRLRSEFKNDSSALKKISNDSTHIYTEFPFLGNLYHRINSDGCFPYAKLRVPDYVREKSNYEPDYFKK